MADTLQYRPLSCDSDYNGGRRMDLLHVGNSGQLPCESGRSMSR